ncbi:EAL domain-containing protein [Aquibacillus sediminis]|uniref:EAL domain-containing protein n=1 Tax=Aquibacillus sediminis TaxID=2574734 RepID=UPI001FEB94B5|nr:EAL domain-containing protein [Aquibacillus sediminis]
MDYEIIAEGIETEEQVEFLKANKCGIGQGYYYSKALPAEVFFELYNQKFIRFKK